MTEQEIKDYVESFGELQLPGNSLKNIKSFSSDNNIISFIKINKFCIRNGLRYVLLEDKIIFTKCEKNPIGKYNLTLDEITELVEETLINGLDNGVELDHGDDITIVKHKLKYALERTLILQFDGS